MIKTAKEFKKATLKEQLKYMAYLKKKVKYDDNGDPTNLMCIVLKDMTAIDVIGAEWDWTSCFYFVRPEYVPYKKAKPKWIGSVVGMITESGSYVIDGIVFNREPEILINNIFYSLEEMFVKFVWPDGSPFGRQKK